MALVCRHVHAHLSLHVAIIVLLYRTDQCAMVVVEAVVALLPWVAVGTAVLLVAFIFVPGFWDKVRRHGVRNN